MDIDVRLTSLTASGGETFQFPRAGVTCIVGSNNVGKSRMLREIDAALGQHDATAATFMELEVEKPVIDDAQSERFLRSVAYPVTVPDGRPPEFQSASGGAQNMSVQSFVQQYRMFTGNTLQSTKPYFAWYVSAGSLLSVASGSVGMPGMNGGGHPLMQLYRQGDLEEELSKLSANTFGVTLTLDRINGNVQLRVGSPSAPVPLLNRPTEEYSDDVRNLPELSQQGDGLKSFLGLALTVLAGSMQILLVDEPEAFLHPAQARALGRWLGQEAVIRDIQVVLSTHDRDLLLGLIDSGQDSVVNIVRLTREESINHIRHLDSDEVRATWQDPVLRYSNLLQGLFHSRAIITESDADCRFYAAVLDQLGLESNRRAISDDLLFVPSGGKQRVALMATSLVRLGVKTFAIVDFDVLRVRSEVQNIVVALGGTWTPGMNEDYITVSNAANQNGNWDKLKKQGLGGLRGGPVYLAGQSLIESLKSVGLLVVPVGEMEDLDKTIGDHGGAWVSEMLAQGNHVTSTGARDLLGVLLD